MTGCRWQGAIFDLDGTLLDSMPVWRDLGDAFLQRQGIAPAPDLAAALAPLSLRQAAVYLRQQYGLTQSPEQLVEQISAMLADCYRFSIPLKPGAAAALQQLRARGLPLALATATEETLAAAALERLGIRRYFAHLLSCSRSGTGKQSPEIYRRAAALLGAAPERTLVFEDAPHAVRTAAGAGFAVIAIADESARDQRAAIQQLAWRYLDSWEEFSPQMLDDPS